MKKWLETDNFEEAFEKFNDNVDEIEQGFDNRYTKQEVDDELNTKADKLDTYTKQEVDNSLGLKADKQQEAWITPTLLNGATGTLQYRKNGFGNVEFKGFVKALTTGTVFQLPNGYYEPNASQLFLGADSSSATNARRIDVSGIGNVTVYHTTSHIYFDGINISL